MIDEKLEKYLSSRAQIYKSHPLAREANDQNLTNPRKWTKSKNRSVFHGARSMSDDIHSQDTFAQH